MPLRPYAFFSLLGLLTILSLGLALSLGSVGLTPSDLLKAIEGDSNTLASQIVLDLRLPRAVNGFAVGGLLALAGALMQVLLRNPLADPYILGVSGGAAVFTLLAILLGLSGIALHLSAFGGALLAMILVFGLAQRRGNWSPAKLLLTGVVMTSGWGALTGFILSISPERALHGMLFWLMGDLADSSRPSLGVTVLFITLLGSLPLARALNILSFGELQAASLGVNIARLRILLYLLASLMTAMAVTLAGSVGFVGLVVPHLLRLLGCRDHRLLLPASVLMGGSLLVIADTLARTLLAPSQLPVGILSALIGVPIFLYLLQRNEVRV